MQFVAEGVNCLDVLAQQLGDKQYMLGSKCVCVCVCVCVRARARA